MNQDDTFFKRLQPLENIAKIMQKSERFGVWNHKTIGAMLVSVKAVEGHHLRQRVSWPLTCG